jgi:hypothetical protein
MIKLIFKLFLYLALWLDFFCTTFAAPVTPVTLKNNIQTTQQNAPMKPTPLDSWYVNAPSSAIYLGNLGRTGEYIEEPILQEPENVLKNPAWENISLSNHKHIYCYKNFIISGGPVLSDSNTKTFLWKNSGIFSKLPGSGRWLRDLSKKENNMLSSALLAIRVRATHSRVAIRLNFFG